MVHKNPKSKHAASKREWQQLGRIHTSDPNKSQVNYFNGIILSIIVGIVMYFLYYGYLETRINTILPYPKVSFDILYYLIEID